MFCKSSHRGCKCPVSCKRKLSRALALSAFLLSAGAASATTNINLAELNALLDKGNAEISKDYQIVLSTASGTINEIITKGHYISGGRSGSRTMPLIKDDNTTNDLVISAGQLKVRAVEANCNGGGGLFSNKSIIITVSGQSMKLSNIKSDSDSVSGGAVYAGGDISVDVTGTFAARSDVAYGSYSYGGAVYASSDISVDVTNGTFTAACGRLGRRTSTRGKISRIAARTSTKAIL